MKLNLNFKFITLCALLVLAPLSYADGHNNTDTSIQQIEKKANKLLDTLTKYSVDKKDEMVQKTKKNLEEFDKEVDALETKIDNNWDKMNKKVRKQARQNLRELRKDRNEVASWYGSMKTSSVQAWEDIKGGFVQAYKDLQKSWKKSLQELEQNK